MVATWVVLAASGVPGFGQGRQVVLILGDSLTAGYGLQNPGDAFPGVLQEKIDLARLPFEVVGAGVSGDTSAGGLRRVDWLLKRDVDILVLELGANDGLRGLPLASTLSNLQGIIDRVRKKNAEVGILIAGMMVPPNLGPDYATQFRRLFEELAAKNQGILIPFLLEGVAGRPELNLSDGIHPTSRGHQLVAETVWKHLEPMLRARLRQR